MIQQLTGSQPGMQQPDTRVSERHPGARPWPLAAVRHDILGLQVPQKRRTGRTRPRRHISIVLADGCMQEDELLALSALCELKARDDAHQGLHAAVSTQRAHPSALAPPPAAARLSGHSSSSSGSQRRHLRTSASLRPATSSAAPNASAFRGPQAVSGRAAPQQPLVMPGLHLQEHLTGAMPRGTSGPACDGASASAAGALCDGVWSKEASPTGSPPQQQRSCSAASDLTGMGPLLNLLAPCGSPTATAAAAACGRPVGQSRLAGLHPSGGHHMLDLAKAGAAVSAAAQLGAGGEPQLPKGPPLATCYGQASHMVGVAPGAAGGPSNGSGAPSSGAGCHPHSGASPSSCMAHGGLAQGLGLGLGPAAVSLPTPLGGGGLPLSSSAPSLPHLFLEAAARFSAPMETMLLGCGLPGLLSQQLGVPAPAVGLQQQGNALLLAAVLTAQQGPAAALLAGASAGFTAPAVAAAAAAARAVEEHLSVAFGSSRSSGAGGGPALHHLVQGVPTTGLPPGQVDALAALPALASIPAAAAAAAAGGMLGLPAAGGMDLQLAQAWRGAAPLPLPGWLNLGC